MSDKDSTPAPQSDSQPSDEADVSHKPLTRKLHRKSRKGCVNCKRRRVKCQETYPECANCQRLGLRCSYTHPAAHQSQSPTPSTALQLSPRSFTRDDLRFFHHFLLTAYPPLPLRGDAIWQNMAQLSHEYDFLLDAMLGLAASHLSLTTGNDNSSTALTHRVRSINSLNSALNAPCSSIADADARFAAIMALTFQASYMPGGTAEFLTMIRGCILVPQATMSNYMESAFRPFFDEHSQTVYSLNEGRSKTGEYETFVTKTTSSLEALRPLCRSVLEVEYLANLETVLKAATTSYVDAFMIMGRSYTILGEYPTSDFDTFISISNHASQLVLAHFFIIEFVFGGLALQSAQHPFPFQNILLQDRISRTKQELPDSHQKYLAWPVEFAKSVQQKTYSNHQVIALPGSS